MPCYQWNRSLITLGDHPLHHLDELTLEDLCEYPLITYVYGFTGRGRFSQTFRDAGLVARRRAIEAELERINPNWSRRKAELEGMIDEVDRQYGVLEDEADEARVPMQWRD